MQSHTNLRAAAACGFSAPGAFAGKTASWLAGWERALERVESLRRRGARIFYSMVSYTLVISRLAVLAVVIALVATCCTSTKAYPRASCLFDHNGRYDAGRVIAQRESDGAELFQFNDSSKGDHGFRWVTPETGRTLRPCREATLMDAAKTGVPPELAQPNQGEQR